MNSADARLCALVLVRPLLALDEAGRDVAPRWRDTFVLLAVPLIATSVVLSQLLYQVVPTGLPPEAMPHPVGFAIYSMLLMSFGVLALALSAHYIAELYQGVSDFDRAMRAVTLSLVPAWLGNVLAVLPWPWGNGLALLLIGYSMALLPLAFARILGIRKRNRLGHYVATLLTAVFLCIVIGWLLIDLVPGARPEVRLGTTWLI